MDSILTNSAALSALQSLNMTQTEMNITQNQVSTGLAVATAADNAAYWAIGQQLNSDNGLVTTTNTALAQSQAMLDTANSAIQSIITTIDSIQSAITEATNPGASLANINTTLASLSHQLTQTINGASFNGVNLLNGTQTTMSFVSGYDASSTGGSVNTVSLTAQALVGGQNTAQENSNYPAGDTPAGTGSPVTTVVTDSNLISQLETNANLAANGSNAQKDDVLTLNADTANGTATAVGAISDGNQSPTVVSYGSGNDPAGNALVGAAADDVIQAVSTDAAGDVTTTTYTAWQVYNGPGATGNVASTDVTAGDNKALEAYSATNTTGANVWTVSTNTVYDGATAGGTTPTPQGLLIQNGQTLLQGNYNLTQLGGDGTGATASFTQVTVANAADMISAVNAALAAVTTYAATIGSTQDTMTAAATFNSALSTDYTNGVSALVDADMNTASTRLQALQTQEQLGIQSLSIANQNSQLILKLFNG